MNIEHPTSNLEWEKMKKQTDELKDMLLDFSIKMLKIV